MVCSHAGLLSTAANESYIHCLEQAGVQAKSVIVCANGLFTDADSVTIETPFLCALLCVMGP